MYDMLPTCCSYLSPREVLIPSMKEEETEAQKSLRPPRLPCSHCIILAPRDRAGLRQSPRCPSPPGSPVCTAQRPCLPYPEIQL